MAKGFKHGAGGGTSLNFKVVSNPQPENPKENTIWIDTDEKITGWYFGAEKPNPTSVEIYTEDGATIGKYLNSSGAETSGTNSDWMITDKINLPNETTSVQITAGTTGGSNPYHWFYDESGNRISGVVRQAGTVTYDVPTGAKSIRISLLPTEDDKSIVANCYVNEEGMVWICTGESSPAEFNALKKNGIQVYPISAKQYVGGAWITKSPKIYQDGEWRGWITYLYNSGEINDLIGGFTSYAYRHSGSGSTEVKPTQTNGTDSITLKIALGSNGSAAGSCFGNNKIDVTDYSKLCIHVASASNGSTGSTCHTKFGLTSTRASGYQPVASVSICDQDEKVTDEVFSLDISELSGSYYFYITFFGSRTQNMTFTKLYFEG